MLASPASAQLFGSKSVLIKNAKVLDGTGREIDGVDLMIKGKRFAQLGKGLKGAMFTKVIDAEGMTITPGFIDSWSSLGRLDESDRGAAYGSAWDTFDRYDTNLFREALAQGVTAMYLEPGGGTGVRGHGALISLKPNGSGPYGEQLESDDALTFNFGSGNSPLQRLRTFSRVRAAFRKANEYGEALEVYEEELEEYLEKLEERRKESGKEDKADTDNKDSDKNDAEKKKDGKKKGDKKGPKKDKPDPDKPKPDKPKPDEPKPDEPKPDDTPDSSRVNLAPSGGTVAQAGDEAQDFENNCGPRKKGKRRGGKKGKKKEEKSGDGEDEEEEELKKPEPPKPDRESDEILKAINKELAVRVIAHRSADILNALELAEEFNLRMVLVGATDAALVAEQLADSKVPVVLGPVNRDMSFENNEFRRHDMRTASVLESHGVEWALGTGDSSTRSGRFIGQQAQLTAGRNPDVKDWLPLITTRSARLLGLERRGRIAPGLYADFVLWTGDPGDPGSVVHRVYIDGEIAYEAAAKAGGPTS